MTSEIPGMQSVLEMIEGFSVNGIESTGATVVNFSGGLYNVTGSTKDPKKVHPHEGEAWKQLLISLKVAAENSKCYADTPVGEKTHPAFAVGGHMTTAQNGIVAKGGTCYLMPLCSWHNSTSKDGIKFTHTHTQMLQLSGYNEGELAATFQLRLPSEQPYALLYHSAQGWKHENLSKEQAENLDTAVLANLGAGPRADYVLFERVRGENTLHVIRKVHLPSAQA